MASQIQLTRSGTPGAQPTATEMELGELALNYADGKLYFKNDLDNIELLNSMSNMSGQKIIVNETDNHIGLNTTSPEFLLDLGGSVGHADNTHRINQNDDGTAIRIGGSANGDITLLRVDNLDGETDSAAEGFSIKYLGTNSNNELGIFTDNGSSELQALTILQNGNIGIRNNTPSHELDVAGTIRVTNSTNLITFNDGSENIGFINNNSKKLQINAGGSVDTLQLQTNGVDVLIIDNNQNVGIGTDAPSRPLEIEDDTNDGTGGAIIHSFLPTLELKDKSTNGTSLFIRQDNAETVFSHDNNERLRISSVGNVTAGGNVTATGNAIAATPTADTHLTTKAYVDNSIKHGSTPTYSGNQAVTGRTNYSFGMALQHQGCHTNRPVVYSVSTNSVTPTFIDALDVKITPRDVNSGIMIQAMLNGEGNSAEENIVYNIHRKIGSNTTSDELGIRTDATNGLLGARMVGITTQQYDNDEHSTMNNIFIQFIDTPSTTEEVTYSIAIKSGNSTTWTLNSVNTRSTNDDAYERATSNVILTELAGMGT